MSMARSQRSKPRAMAFQTLRLLTSAATVRGPMRLQNWRSKLSQCVGQQPEKPTDALLDSADGNDYQTGDSCIRSR